MNSAPLFNIAAVFYIHGRLKQPMITAIDTLAQDADNQGSYIQFIAHHRMLGRVIVKPASIMKY